MKSYLEGKKKKGAGTSLWSQHLEAEVEDLAEFQGNLVYIGSSRPTKASWKDPVSK